MPRATWPLLDGRPRIEVVLTLAAGGGQTTRTLLADTGAGSEHAAFDLILDEDDCLLCGGNPTIQIQLAGAFTGWFPVYGLNIQIPQIGLNADYDVIGVPHAPKGVDGIAGFRFLNRFGFGNFGDHNQFGIET